MKKSLILIIVGLMAFSAVSCGKSKPENITDTVVPPTVEDQVNIPIQAEPEEKKFEMTKLDSYVITTDEDYVAVVQSLVDMELYKSSDYVVNYYSYNGEDDNLADLSSKVRIDGVDIRLPITEADLSSLGFLTVTSSDVAFEKVVKPGRTSFLGAFTPNKNVVIFKGNNDTDNNVSYKYINYHTVNVKFGDLGDDTNLFGITKNSTPYDVVSLIGNPDSISLIGKELVLMFDGINGESLNIGFSKETGLAQNADFEVTNAPKLTENAVFNTLVPSITVDGVAITLPLKVQQIRDLGFEVVADKETVPAGESIDIGGFTKKGNLVIFLGENDKEFEADYKDLDYKGLVILPERIKSYNICGITEGMDMAAVKQLLGEPDSILDEPDESGCIYFYYGVDNFMLSVADTDGEGKVTSVMAEIS